MDTLNWAIFSLGSALSLAWLSFLVFGAKKGAAEDDQQTLDFKGLKLGLGSSVWVMTLFVGLAALPLGLNAWRPPPPPPQQLPPPKCPSPSAEIQFHVSGTVLDCDGHVLGGAWVTATDSGGKSIFNQQVQDDGSYAFSAGLRLGDSDDSLTIQTKKDKYRPQRITLFANAINFQPVLASGASP
jgi:hypothetical protein